MESDLISIIIPTYNRAHLIIDTLNSIINQSYKNWECLVIDDCSNDNTEELIKSFILKNQKIKFYKRPNNRPKGANSCRNYGLELSKGNYINWFDSDDLMVSNFLESKIDFLKNHNLDFVVSKTKFFYTNGKQVKPDYTLLKTPISLNNFVCKNQFWLTLDGLFTKASLGDVKWDESLNSGQEFNFICKYLGFKKEGRFIDQFLAHARVHDQSIHSEQNKSKVKFNTNKYLVYLKTYIALKQKGVFENSNQDVKKQLIKSIMSHSFNLKLLNSKTPKSKLLFKELLLSQGILKTIIFKLSLIFADFFKKGYKLMNFARS